MCRQKRKREIIYRAMDSEAPFHSARNDGIRAALNNQPRYDSTPRA